MGGEAILIETRWSFRASVVGWAEEAKAKNGIFQCMVQGWLTAFQIVVLQF